MLKISRGICRTMKHQIQTGLTMTKYCPQCQTEYKDDITICPDDNSPLSSSPPKETPFSGTVDIYAAASEVEAERIVTFLRDEGIDAKELQTQIAQVPTPSDMRYFICVRPEHRDQAIKLIESARDDQVISSSGAFL